MATGRTDPLILHLRRAVLRPDSTVASDGQLLERFIIQRDETAFEVLLQRHGPMVLGVCRRMLGNPQDAEDAFQATFLVLARKAASVFPRQMVGNWLYGVAHTTALRARVANLRRRSREKQVAEMPEPHAAITAPPNDVLSLLDQELAGLPEKYRVAIVLCDLEGRTRREVARQLKVPEGTLSSRLTAGRRLLAKRLARHGLQVGGGVLLTILSARVASATVPIVLQSSTARAGLLVAAGQAASAGVVTAPVTALTEGVLRMMLLSKLKVATAVLVVAGVLTLGGGMLARYTAVGQEVTSQPRGVLPKLVPLAPQEAAGTRGEGAGWGRPGDEADQSLRHAGPDGDLYVANVRSFALPIQTEPASRANMKQLHLLVSADQGTTWEVAATVTPDAPDFPYTAPDDGLYWFQVQVVYRDGGLQPRDLDRTSGPSLKVRVDTTKHGSDAGRPPEGNRKDTSKARGPTRAGDLVWDRLGLRLEAVDQAAVSRASRDLHGGMRIVAVRSASPGSGGEPGVSPAGKAKLQAGDILVGLHDWAMLGRDDVLYTLGYCQGAGWRSLPFVVVRGDQLITGRLSLIGGDKEE